MNTTTTTEKQLLEIVSQNAHVIDFDFSKWYKFIRIVIATQHEIYDYYPSLYHVDFLEVTKLSWEYNSLDIEEISEEEKHCRWTILTVEMAKQGQFQTIVLSGGMRLPVLSIKCRNVEIGEMSRTIVDSLNQGWNEPYRPLARPSLIDMYDMYIVQKDHKRQRIRKKNKADARIFL